MKRSEKSSSLTNVLNHLGGIEMKGLYLKQDVERAVKETKCIDFCLEDIKENLVNNNLHEAKHAAVDLLNSIQALEELQMKKVQNDRLSELFKALSSNNGLIERMRKMGRMN